MPSRARYVLASLRHDIISGALARGEHLIEESLCERYGVSRLPIREALRVLEEEGFVVIAPNRGATVATMDADEAIDLFAVRDVVGLLTAGRAADNAKAEDVDRLMDIVRRGRDAHRLGEVRDEATLDAGFHRCVAEIAGSDVLTQMLRQVCQMVEWLFDINYTTRDDAWPAYAAIVAAIARGSSADAGRIMQSQLSQQTVSYRFRAPSPTAGPRVNNRT